MEPEVRGPRAPGPLRAPRSRRFAARDASVSVQSVERAFAVLRVLATGATGVTDIADRVGLPKSTVSRLLGALEGVGAVDQDRSGGHYRIGADLIRTIVGSVPGRDLVDVARPHLVELRDALGESTGISVLEGDQVRYLSQVDSDNPVMVRDWTGESVPWHVVSSGVVLVAALDERRRDAVMARRRAALTEHSVVDRAAVLHRLGSVREAGHAWTVEEYVEGITSVAAPVYDRHGHAVAAVHAHGPAYRFPGADARDRIARVVAATAGRVSGSLAP